MMWNRFSETCCSNEKSVTTAMHNSGEGSRNRHSPGLAAADGRNDGKGACSGHDTRALTMEIGARRPLIPVPICTENPVKQVASAAQDESLTGPLNHLTAGRLPSPRQPLAVGAPADWREARRLARIHRGWRAVSLAAVLIAGLFAPSALAQAVPTPTPKPAPKTRSNVQMTASDKSPTATVATPAKPPEPVIPDPHRNVPTNIFATFDANQKALATKVSNY